MAAPVTAQPQGQVQWMSAPQAPPNCPPGLEYLALVDQLLVHQKTELLEAFIGYETNNKYEIKNSLGQRVYFAAEDTNCCSRNICGPSRAFEIKILDNNNREVVRLTRPLRCSTCWCPCCLQRVEVQAPPGETIGYVKQAWSVCTPKFYIQNAAGEDILRIDGPCFTCSMCGDVEFDISSKNGDTQVGRISKQWTGLVKEVFTDADNFGVVFPMDLDVKAKATTLAATFLIDFMFFEKKQNKEGDAPTMMG
ncbi:phospholipid scramblase 1-like isoform X2 [Watersipora subatra]|uniref:phospholipid scramblase 1-like isoform X2 n=1 Tax=Watersipora subatra TaxID=2589382 RepID=UPI00355B9226